MGLWDMVKKAAVGAKCMAGIHAGEYHQEEGKPLCYFSKICPDCGKYLVDHKLRFGQWQYIHEGKCDLIKTCIYCGEARRRVDHEYDIIGKDSKCHIIEVCCRCGDRRVGEAQHNWEITKYGNKQCINCGYIDREN